jgi:hypothetical protein
MYGLDSAMRSLAKEEKMNRIRDAGVRPGPAFPGTGLCHGAVAGGLNQRSYNLLRQEKSYCLMRPQTRTRENKL